MPKLSIITINKNNAQGLEKTIQSVINQTYKDFEYTIIDRASTDGSVEIIKKYQNKIDYWISEPDKGIYNAMNKGIKVAKGKYLLFLNSGDWLIENNVLERVFNIDFSEDIVYGNIKVDNKWIKQYPKHLTLRYFIKDTLPHPASFIKTSLFEKTGFYDENYIIASDFKFFVQGIILLNCSYRKIDLTISVFHTGGKSSDLKQVNLEREEILTSLSPRIYPDYQYFNNELKKLELLKNSFLCRLANKLYKSKFYRAFKNVTQSFSNNTKL
jgi:glycosyltransferase involved in cell wall biosynthesis